MVSTKEVDNAHYAIIALSQIKKYTSNENVILDETMEYFLHTLSEQLELIEKYYERYIANDKKITGRLQNQLLNAMKKTAYDTRGDKVELTSYDSELISVIDTIMYKYDEAVQKSKTIPEEIKIIMSKCCDYWYSFEKYIVNS